MQKTIVASIVLGVTLLLSACGGSSAQTSSPLSPEGVSQVLASAVSALERDGTIPMLDRSNSVLGPDVDGDGVRDDIQKWIDSLPDTPAQKAALRQKAKAERLILAAGEAGDKALARKLMVENMRAIYCISEKYTEPRHAHPQSFHSKTKELGYYLENTLARKKASQKVDSLLSGGVYGVKGAACD